MRAARLAVLAAAALTLATPAGGEPRWIQDVPGDVPTAGESPAVVLHRRTEVVVDEQLRARWHERRVLKILRPEGVDVARFEVGIEPGGRWTQARAWTIGADGTRESGAREVVESQFAAGFVTDVRRVVLPAPVPAVGDRVAFEFVWEEPLPFTCLSWYPGSDGLATERAEFAIALPAGWSIATRVDEGLQPLVDSSAASRREFHASRLPRITGTDVPWRLVRRGVHLRLLDGRGDRFSDWRHLAAWYHALAAPHAAAAAAPSELAGLLAGGDAVRRMAAMSQEVQQRVHYAAVELGAQRWVPDRASDTWTRRYGDCKDKSVLLISALAAAGIDARAALTCTRDAATPDSAWPDPARFNHCVVAIAWPGPQPPRDASVLGPSGRTWTLFDPTDAHTPLGQLPWAIGGAWTVIADPNEGLVRAPDVDPGLIRISVQARLAADGALTGALEWSASGAAAAVTQERFGAVDDTLRARRLADLLSARGARARVWSVRGRGIDSIRFESGFTCEFSLDGAARRAGSLTMLSLPLPMRQSTPPPPDSNRSAPVWAGWSPVVEQHIALALPAGASVVELPKAGWSGPEGEYHMTAEVADGSISIRRRFRRRDGVIPSLAWPGTRALLSVAYRTDNSPVLLRSP